MHARTHHVLPMAGGEDEDDPLQMMLNTKKKREQTDEEMRVRVDEDVERMMENGVKINPSASNVKTRRLGSGRVGHPWREAPSHSRAAALQGSRAELGAPGPRSAAGAPASSRQTRRAHLNFDYPGCSARATARPRAECDGRSSGLFGAARRFRAWRGARLTSVRA